MEHLVFEACDEKYLLTPEISQEIQFKVLVRNLVSDPLPDITVEVSFVKRTCTGDILEIYYKELTTNENGIFEGEVHYDFRWDIDEGEWQLQFQNAGQNQSGYIEKFGVNKSFLYTVLTIAELEN
jgi:hypothetical protein